MHSFKMTQKIIEIAIFVLISKAEFVCGSEGFKLMYLHMYVLDCTSHNINQLDTARIAMKGLFHLIKVCFPDFLSRFLAVFYKSYFWFIWEMNFKKIPNPSCEECLNRSYAFYLEFWAFVIFVFQIEM